jgi:hypothetical protein
MAVAGARVSRGPLPRSGNALRPSSPVKCLVPGTFSMAVCHSNATRRRWRTRFYFRKSSYHGAPLRNRTVDLLLTMNHRQVALPQVGRVTRQNTSTGQHRQAPGRLSRALFATQSATHFDLVPSGSPPHRPSKGRPDEGRSGPGKFTVTVSGTRHFFKPIMRRRAEASGRARRLLRQFSSAARDSMRSLSPPGSRHSTSSNAAYGACSARARLDGPVVWPWGRVRWSERLGWFRADASARSRFCVPCGHRGGRTVGRASASSLSGAPASPSP